MRIVIYGDSNSWGLLDDGTGLRYDSRWPQIMGRALGAKLPASQTDSQTNCQSPAIEIIEECLPGRTTAYPDPQEGPEYNGLPYLKPSLLSHAPIDMVLIMLGTNDGKARFAASADDIADNLITLAKIIRRAPVGKGPWRDGTAPKVIIISPPNLGKRAYNPSWPRFDEWLGGYDKLAALPSALAHKHIALSDEGISILDSNPHVTPSERDPIHWPAASHHSFGAFMAEHISLIAQ